MGVPPVDWEAESYPAYSDFAAIPLFAVFLFAVRYLLDRFVFEVVMVFTVLFPHHAHFRIVTGVVRWREGWGAFLTSVTRLCFALINYYSLVRIAIMKIFNHYS